MTRAFVTSVEARWDTFMHTDKFKDVRVVEFRASQRAPDVPRRIE
jgi:hypothetical protein